MDLKDDRCPFLGVSSDAEIRLNRGKSSPGQHQPRETMIAWTLHLTFILCYTFVFLAITILTIGTLQGPNKGALGTSSASIPYSPANNAIEYVNIPLHSHGTNNPFTGYPDMEFDLAWHELLKGTTLRITSDELAILNTSSIAMKGGGYSASLSVYHHLHCIKRIKQYQYPQKYFKGLTEDDMQREFKHIDHCLDVLRHFILCHADVSVITYAWPKTNSEKVDVLDNSPRRCVNWERLEAWALERSVDGYKSLEGVEEYHGSVPI